MIVLDASIVVELLTRGGLAGPIRGDIGGRSDSFIAPYLLDVEVLSALRKLNSAHRLDSHRCQQFLTAILDFPVERYSHTPLLGRIWELRHNFTAYDAAYVALAEATDATLYTSDAKLTKGHRARVKLFTHAS